MGRVVVERRMMGADVDAVWRLARQLTDYPRFMEQVLTVEDVERPEGSATSWVVLFNGNELRWIELDHYDEARRIMRFEQIEGDLAEWRGRFEARVCEDGVLALYDVEFDLGIPALAHVLHPLAERGILANCSQMLEELELRTRGAAVAPAV